jgi:hypothetical protein
METFLGLLIIITNPLWGATRATIELRKGCDHQIRRQRVGQGRYISQIRWKGRSDDWVKSSPNGLYYLSKYAVQHIFGEERDDDGHAFIILSKNFARIVKAAKNMLRKNYALI